MAEPRISVALCTYNGARFVRYQLDSIAAQTALPAEVVVSDDASTDATTEVVEAFAATAPFAVRLLHNAERMGAPANFGRAIAACEGDFIALADQDDVWLPEKLAATAAALGDDPERAYAFCDATLVDDRVRPLGGRTLLARRFPPFEIRRGFAGGREIDLMLKRDFIYGTTLMVRAAARDTVLPIESGWSHDTWICNMLAFLGYRGVPMFEPLVRYRQHGDQHSGGIGAPRPIPYALQRDAYVVLRERLVALSAHTARSIVPGGLALIDGKIRYLGALASMQGRPPHQAALIAARELASGRWRRYSPRIFFMNSRPWDRIVSRR